MASTTHDETAIHAILAAMSQQQSASKSRSSSAALPPLPQSPTPASAIVTVSSPPAASRTPPPPRQSTSTRLRYGSTSETEEDIKADPSYANAYSPAPAQVLKPNEANARKRGRSLEDDEASLGGAATNASKVGKTAAKDKDDKGEDWSRTRKDNHKEVERRRRETINDGINDLKEIVPGCEKNKGSILQRAVQYIQQLKDAEARNIEKWTLEKLLSDQAMAEARTESESWKSHATSLEEENDTLREENERLRAELVKAGVGIVDTPEEGGGKRRKVE